MTHGRPHRSPRCRASAARSSISAASSRSAPSSFVIIFVMMFAGIFAELVAPYDPLDIDFAAHPGAALLGALVRHRRLRPRHPLAHHLRLAHRAGDRLHLVVRRLDARRDPRHRVGLFRRQDRRLDPALHRHPAGLPDHRAGAGRGRGAAQVVVCRHRRQPDLSPSPSRSCRASRAWCAPPRCRSA